MSEGKYIDEEDMGGGGGKTIDAGDDNGGSSKTIDDGDSRGASSKTIDIEDDGVVDDVGGGAGSDDVGG